MTFRFDAAAALAKVRAQAPTRPNAPKVRGVEPTALGRLGTLGRGQPQNAEMRDAFEERAAIMEFDGEMSRTDAEAAAWADVAGHPWSLAIARVWADFEAMNDPHDPKAWA